MVDVRGFDGCKDLEGVVRRTEGGKEAEGVGKEEGVLVVAGFENEGVDCRELSWGFALFEERDELGRVWRGFF